MRIYTFGYSGKQPEELIEFARAMRGWVADVRFSPYGRNPTWNRDQLQRAVDSALGNEKYQWVKGFGNSAYATGGIRLHNPTEAAEFIRAHSSLHGDPILVCACREFKSCHRTHAATFLSQAAGNASIEHLGFPQRDIFG